MTIHDVASQLHNLSVGGYFNGVKFTTGQLQNCIADAFCSEATLAIPHTWVMEISLPDGRWFFSIEHYNDKPDGFDYTIPDSREQESKLLDRLTKQGA
jgi:hypothetical protein